MRDRAAVRLPIRSRDLDDGCVYQIDRLADDPGAARDRALTNSFVTRKAPGFGRASFLVDVRLRYATFGKRDSKVAFVTATAMPFFDEVSDT